MKNVENPKNCGKMAKILTFMKNAFQKQWKRESKGE